MILCLLFVCLLGESIALNGTSTAGGGDFSKSIMCYFLGNTMDSNTELVNLEPKNIPCECEVIIYGRCEVTLVSGIDVDKTLLKSVTDLNKPVILQITRHRKYEDWGKILGSDGNAEEAKILCDFALKNNVKGYLIEGFSPKCMTLAYDENIGKNFIPYLKQLKCSPEFIVGVIVDATGSSIKNPSMYNFAEMNDLVTFYEINTYLLNPCKPKMYNGQTPITKVDHGANYLFGMEEVVSFLKESKICLTKTTFDIEMYPSEVTYTSYTSYAQVCKGDFNSSSWCVQTTKNFFDKGKFVSEQNSGIIVKILDLDDINNDCGCSSAFIGFQNIIAGFHGGSQIPCEKFDVQCDNYSVQ